MRIWVGFKRSILGERWKEEEVGELMVGRVARILHSDGTETRQLCSGPDIEAAQAAAIEWIKQNMRPDFGDEMVIENPGMSSPSPRLTAEDVVFLRGIKVSLWGRGDFGRGEINEQNNSESVFSPRVCLSYRLCCVRLDS
jgi:hypothetical protein